jgi:hypothetical protein
MPLILGANQLTAGGYEVDNSLRFNSGSSDRLNRTLSSGTSNTIGTISLWVKRANLSATKCIFGVNQNGDNFFNIQFGNSSDQLNIRLYDDGSPDANYNTTAVFRDVSAWYHVVIAFDTTQATSSNRIKVYVNNTLHSLSGYPSQNQTMYTGTSGVTMGVGDSSFNSSHYDGYLSEYYFIDGQALDPTDFGEFDEDTNIWKPIPYTGSFGTNGFYLEFKDSSALGDDTSGNGNDFTVNNLTSVDQSTDTPMNNFATLNPIAAQAGSGVSSAVNTFTEGNLKVADLASDTAISNFGVSTGKWFWEVQVVTDQDGIAIGACNEGFHLNAELGYNSPASQANGKVFGYYGSGSKFTTIGDGTHFSAYGSAIAVNDIIGVALNLDSNEVTFYKNGSSQGTFSITALGSGENYFPAIGNWSASAVVANYNFGSPPFTISSGNSDAEGIGNFEHAVPSGYFALCTKNLADYG